MNNSAIVLWSSSHFAQLWWPHLTNARDVRHFTSCLMYHNTKRSPQSSRLQLKSFTYYSRIWYKLLIIRAWIFPSTTIHNYSKHSSDFPYTALTCGYSHYAQEPSDDNRAVGLTSSLFLNILQVSRNYSLSCLFPGRKLKFEHLRILPLFQEKELNTWLHSSI